MFASLRHIDYRYLWSGTLMMSAGQWVQQVTLGWLLYDLTGNSLLLGALNGLRALPFLVTGPMAGVAADRMNRRKLLKISVGGATAAYLAVPAGWVARAQDNAQLTYQGKIEFWDWEFAPRQAAEDGLRRHLNPLPHGEHHNMFGAK